MIVYLAMIEAQEDKDKFEEVYLKYRYLMLHVANEILHNHHDAEDVVHEAFVAILRNLDKISQIDSPKTRSFVVVIVERKAIDLLRKKQREDTLELNEDILGMVMLPEPVDNGLADAMVRLPAQYREVLLLRYDNDLTNRDIAKLFGITQSGVRKLLGRAKRKLQVELERGGEVK